MTSFEKRYHLGDASFSERLRRDARMARELLAFVLYWLTAGRRIRRAHRRAEQEHRSLVLEDLFGERRE